MTEYKVTIGLEIHVALKTDTKLFSRSSGDFNALKFSLFDAGVPGMMPILSKKPVEMALAFAYSVNAHVPEKSYFERKHYFYADLPLGYQITQQHQPIMIGGEVPIDVDGTCKVIKIEHAHLECDAAKSIHDKYSDYTAIDLTRCATPLLEIVSTPCIHSPKEAKLYAQEVCSLVKFLKICDGKLEEGSFRVDASISLSKTEKLGERVEIKNISSFSFLEKALEFEIIRQKEILEQGGKIINETRLFDEKTLTTQSMRKKETAQEYRYMPDPDIPVLVIEKDLIQEVQKKYDISYLGTKNKVKSLLAELGVEIDDAIIEKILFKNIVLLKDWIKCGEEKEKLIKPIFFWVLDILDKKEFKKQIKLIDILDLMRVEIQAKEFKSVLELWLNDESDKKISDFMPSYMNDDDLLKIIDFELNQYTKEIEKYKNGELKILQFLIGKVMSKLKGQATAQKIKDIVMKIINK